MITGESIAAVELPPELWPEILVRLPVKVLVRSRCVSKTWRSIIDNPSFIHLHSNRSKNNCDKNLLLVSEIVYDMETPIEVEWKITLRSTDGFIGCEEIISLNLSPPGFLYLPKSYIDGLVLIEGLSRRSRASFCYILFNPSIRKLVALPPPPCCPGARFQVFLGLDPHSNDYKVVMIRFPHFQRPGDPSVVIASYALSTGCWSNTRTSTEFPNGCDLGMRVYAKGAVHWMYKESRGDPLLENYTHIFSFDISSETFSHTRLPGDQDYDSKKVTIPFLLGDSLAISDVSATRTCIWVLKRYGGSETNSWSKWYNGPTDSETFRLFEPHLGTDDALTAVKVLYAEGIGKILFTVGGNRMKSYDLGAHMMEDLEISLPSCPQWRVMGPYVESLLLANASSGHSWTSIPEENLSTKCSEHCSCVREVYRPS